MPKGRAVYAVDFSAGKVVCCGTARREVGGGSGEGIHWSVIKFGMLWTECWTVPFVRVGHPRRISGFMNLTKDTENPPPGIAHEASAGVCSWYGVCWGKSAES